MSTASVTMQPLSSSRKRTAPTSDDNDDDIIFLGSRKVTGMPTPRTSQDRPRIKRARLSPQNSSSPPSTTTSISTDGQVHLTTPLSSPPTAVPTMQLTLTIPRTEVNFKDGRKLANRRNAARRWIPKLQRPFPPPSEVNKAYPLKLMRHYPGTASTSSESNFIKPQIDRSARVDRLRRQFPLLATTTGVPVMPQGPVATIPMTPDLKKNILATSSTEAERSAWRSFSRTEKDRVDRGREAMMESGMDWEDIYRESRGLANRLPEWRKKKTGRFAQERQRAKQMARKHSAPTP